MCQDTGALDEVAAGLRSGIRPAPLLATAREKYPGLLIKVQDVYKVKAYLKKHELGGRTPIEALIERFAKDDNWLTDAEHDAENRLRSLFFTTAKQVEYYRAFSDLIMIDITYSTNQYNMPLLHIAARVPTGQ
jgi:hypothetical protein